MQKPNGFDNALQSFAQPELGGHRIELIQVEETQSKTGKDMIRVMFDFADDDSQPEFFQQQFDKNTKPDKKWSIQATKYILVYDSRGNTSRDFRLFCDAVEKSNEGFKIQWKDDSWGLQFSRKLIGGVYGEEMDFYNGNVTKKAALRQFIPISEVETAEIPEISIRKAYQEYLDRQEKATEVADDSLPF